MAWGTVSSIARVDAELSGEFFPDGNRTFLVHERETMAGRGSYVLHPVAVLYFAVFSECKVADCLTARASFGSGCILDGAWWCIACEKS